VRAAALLDSLGPRLAALGDVAEMLLLGNAAHDDGDTAAAAAWLGAAVQVAKAAKVPEQGECAVHKLLHRLAELQVDLFLYIYIYVHVYVLIYIYTYTYINRVNPSARCTSCCIASLSCRCHSMLYICIYI